MVINNNTVKTISFMGSGVTSLSYNGVVVWEMEQPSVPTVTLTLTGGTQEYHTYADGIIPNYAFASRNDVSSVNIGSGITYIGYSFVGEYNLTSVTMADTVITIGDSAFSNCTGLTSINIPDSVTSIGNNAFNGDRSLTSLTIGSGVTSIGEYAFSDCSGLASVVVPDSVTSIGDYAFVTCSYLTAITIPSGITEMKHIIGQCQRLSSITCKATTAPTLVSSGFHYLPSTGTLYVPTGSDYSSWIGSGSYSENQLASTWTITYI